jgi:hypothetical protein
MMGRTELFAALTLVTSSLSACGGTATGIPVGVPVLANSCDTTPPRSTGTIYYYCDCGAGAAPGCVAGNNANAGTSPSAPRQTLDDATTRFGSMVSGSTIALCRGGIWTSSNFGYLPNKTCGTADSTWCDIRDYIPSWGSQSTAKPLVNLGSGGFGIAFVNNTVGFRLWNVAFKSTTTNHDAGDGMVGVYDAATGFDICNVTVDGGRVGMNIQTTGTTQSYVRQSLITNIGNTGVYQICSNITYEYNIFLNNQQNNTVAGYFLHDHYIYGATSNVVIRNSEYYTTADHCTQANQCAGVMIYWTDAQTNPIFENNYLHGVGKSSHYAFSSSDNGSSTQNNSGIIRRNRFDWSASGLGTAVELSCCTNCQFTDNIVIVSTNKALGVPEQTSSCGSGNTGSIVRNNTIYVTGTGGQGIVQSGNEGNNYIFENNAVWSQGTGTCFSLYGAGYMASGHPFDLTTAGNYCRNGTGDALGSVFVDAANGNFKPVAGSPLIGHGNSTYYSPTAIGTVLWDPTDTGTARTPPIDSGALVH